MNTLKTSPSRIFGAIVLAASLGLAGCAGPQYTAAPPSEKLSYMGIKIEKDLYGGPWYGPNYRAPRVVVPPQISAGE